MIFQNMDLILNSKLPRKLMGPIKIIALILALLPVSEKSWGALSLPSPELLLSQAKEGKNQLREVINSIDQNLVEIRDVETFDMYFNILVQLQDIAIETKLDSIYPDAVKKLGHRMVQKGVNWLNLKSDPIEKLLYYHQWMSEPQPSYVLLYSFEIQLKDLKNVVELEQGSSKLERLLIYVTERWPIENSLHRLYRDLLSDLAVKSLRDPNLSESQILFWVIKIYRPESLIEVCVKFQDQVYQITKETKANLHVSIERIYRIFLHSKKLDPGISENLQTQIGDIAVDIFLRSIRFEEKISAQEFDQILEMFSKRHYINLANAWTTYDKIPQSDFAQEYMQRSFLFTQKLRAIGLSVEADALSKSIRSKASSILIRSLNLEGFWEMKDRHGKKWFLNIIFADEGMVFANFAGQNDLSYPMFYVTYDMENKGFVAALRAPDADLNSNIPIRFSLQDDGTLKVINLISPSADSNMIAKKVQSYPDLMSQIETDSKVNFNGIYVGILNLGNDSQKKIELAINCFNEHCVGNMKHPSFFATFNFGNSGKGNVIYLTRGHNKSLGSWMHLRLKMDGKNNLVGYHIDGATGLSKNKIIWKKVSDLNSQISKKGSSRGQ